MQPNARADAGVVTLSADGEPRWIPLGQTSTSIGSAPQVHVRLVDAEVDPVHAEIVRRDHGYLIQRRGTSLWVNGRRASTQPLQDGDLITLGRSALSFRRGRGWETGPSSEQGPDRSFETLARLYAVTRRIYARERLEQVTDQMLRDVVELTEAHRGMLVIFEETSEPRMFRALTVRQGDFDSDEVRMSRTALAKIREQPRPQLWTDIYTDPDLSTAPSIHAANVRSLLAAPILLGSELIGALYLSRSRSSELFDRRQLDVLSLYASQAALLLASANRDRQLSEQVQQFQRDLDVVRERQIVAASPAMQSVLRRVNKVGRSSLSVLLIGETGSGKEVLARELHQVSERAEGPFVAVNCGAIPEQLLESELFGHVRGAFTDATKDRIGRIRSASGGTLFLDEIGEMPLEQQAKLLRVLEDRMVRPVGGDVDFAADFRLICATNQQLDQLVSGGRFRRDLYYRIASFVLVVPPLRERADDAIELARLFLKRHAVLLDRTNARLSAAAMTAIRRHRWDGNVRELEGAIHRALVVAETEMIQPDDLGLSPIEEQPEILPLLRARDNFLKEYVQRVVDHCGGNRTAAARALMTTPRTIFKYLEEI